jgi:hypothetical protein
MSVSISETIASMAEAVQKGNFAEAEAEGNKAPFPLAIAKSALRHVRSISEGAQAVVVEALLDDAQGTGNGIPVAVKRAMIRERLDLERCVCGAETHGGHRSLPLPITTCGAALIKL